MIKAILLNSAMVILLIVIPGFVTGMLSKRFAWSGRVLSLVAGLSVPCCWFLWIFGSRYLLGIEPVGWAHHLFSPGWANFVETLTLLLPVGFAPALAERVSRF